MADRRVSVKIDADVSPFARGLNRAGLSAKQFARELETADSRMSNLVQTGLALGPALIPMGAAAVPAIAGLSTQLGFAAAGAGTALLAFNGVGDALGALNEYQLNPTSENFAKLQEEMRGLGPAAQDFVHFLDEIIPQLQTIREAAQAGLLPGVQRGLDSLLDRLPQVRDIVSEVATAMGDLATEAGQALASERFDDFFTFLETEARPALLDFGRTVGNMVEGIARVFMALNPLSDTFGAGLLKASAAFAAATRNLEDNAGFQEFIDYVQRVGPKAVDALAALGEAAVALVRAAAPVGEVTLPIIEALAKVLAVVADSPAGPALIATAAGLSAVSRSVALYNAANGSALLGLLRGTGREGEKAGKGATAAAKGFGLLGAAVAADMLADLGDTDYTLEQINRQLVLMGKQGAAGDLFTNLAASAGSLSEALHRAVFNDLDVLNRKLFGSSASFGVADEIKELDAALANLSPKDAAAAFRVILREGKRAGLTVAQITELFPQYQAELRLSAKESRAAGGASRSHARGIDEAKRALQAESLAIEENLNAMRARRDMTLLSENSEIAYQAAIDEAKRSLKENGNTLDITTAKGRENKTAILRMAEAWNSQTDAVKNTRGAHKAAIDTFVEVAGHLFKNEKAARRYARELFEIPPNRHTKVELDSAGARTSLREYRAMLGNIPRHVQTTLTVKRVRGGPILPGISNADGGLHEFYADGGIRPPFPPIGAQQPQIQPNHGPAGITWAETGAGPWEAFISGHPAKKERSRDIAEETVDRLGGEVAWKAADGLMLSQIALARQHPLPATRISGDTSLSASVAALRAEVAQIGEHVRQGAASGSAAGTRAGIATVAPKLDKIAGEIHDHPRKLRDIGRAGRGRD